MTKEEGLLQTTSPFRKQIKLTYYYYKLLHFYK
ncbi:hypothetical protein FHS11_001133 [Mucilaginibacter gotjawali]|uniref:Uncharacterized protein n=1 Tax=Mucilaginibacter gotjawali TaxID=1550579 RepID=A0A839SBS4_9SPHI|nr:hypothetical protein [Mucilaginibacter gotjawali]